MNSCIYTGHVQHARYEPVENRFRYSLFMMYIDLAELNRLFRRRLLWSADRPNVAWFRRRDYLGDPGMPVDEAVRNLVKERLDRYPEGPIRMLTHLRYFGYIFNPVTFYYVFDRNAGRVEAIVADITNTPWGESYRYVLDSHESPDTGEDMRFSFPKSFHVSPFLGMDMKYDWRFSRPDAALHVHMTNFREERKIFEAALNLKRREWNGFNLSRLLWTYPPMTLKVIAGIYWQALRLKMKGAAFYAHPDKP